MPKAIENQLEPGNKDYDGKVKGDFFSVINRCQSYCADIFNASAGATKEYRFTICKVIQSYACELVHTARQANGFELGNPDRRKYQDDAVEYIKKIDDLLPVIRRCRCISPKKEQELHKKANNLKVSFNIWYKTDDKRIKENKEKETTAVNQG